jgi:two-component system, OmpR family, phosphate regulon sensor histidine kinase PhoR
MQITWQAWWFAIGRLALVLLIGLLLGLVLGRVWLGLFAALAIYVAWQLVNLFRLEWWVRHRSYADPPDLEGIWGQVVAQVVRLHRRKRFHKQRFLQLLRQIQRSTAALPDGVAILNAQREITWLNRTAAELLRLRGREDLGVRIDNLLRQPQFAAYLVAGDFSRPLVLQSTPSPTSHLALQIAPYGEGQLLLLVRDVSRQMQLESMRKDFVANASHELRSPLTVISGYLETLSQDPALDNELAGPVQEMRRQAERMTAIVQDLLELSKLEESSAAAPTQPVDVVGLLAVLRKDVMARPLHPQTVDLQIDSAAQLLGDEVELHSAFFNLVDNAAKYTAPEGSIKIRWWVDEKGAHFSVSDTGMGIPTQHLPRLTERFYRVDPGRSRATGGSGLGLAIVKHVLQRHEATLAIDSELGRGSTFTCHFPASRLLAVT